jgi:hypothetical protein
MPKVCLYSFPSLLNFRSSFRLHFVGFVGHFATAVLGVDLSIKRLVSCGFSSSLALIPKRIGVCVLLHFVVHCGLRD